MRSLAYKNRGFTALLILIIAAIILVAGGGLLHLNNAQNKQGDTPKNPAESKQGGELKLIDADTGENIMKFSGIVLAGNSSPLFDFNKPLYEEELKSDKLIVLYFYANWCPICKAEIPHLYGAFDDLSNPQVVGFRINYNDNETDDDERNIAREFGVAYQHTKVFLKNGKRILKTPESWESKEKYLGEIQKAFGR